MVTNNNPDKFFTSNGDINVLKGLIMEVRNSLLDMNRYNPDNAGEIKFIDQIARFTKTSLIFKGYISLTVAIQEDINKNAIAYQKFIESISTKYLEYSKTEKTNLDKIYKEKKDTQDDISVIFSKATALIDGYNKNYIIGDTDYVIPKSIIDEPSYGYTDPKILNNSKVRSQKNSAIPAAPFPEFGKPFDNLSEAISNTMVNLTSFKTKNNEKIYKSWAIKTKNGSLAPDPIRTFTKKTPFSDLISKTIKAEYGTEGLKQVQPAGTIKFFIEKLHGRGADGVTPNRKGTIQDQVNPISPIDFSNRMVFAAYIDSFNEDFTRSGDNFNFIGRGEEVPIYKSTSRSLSLTFNIIADYSLDLMLAMENVYAKLGFAEINEEKTKELLTSRANWGLGYIGLPSVNASGERIGGNIPGMYSDTTESLWHKLTFLAQCMYPYYRKDGKMKEQPMIRLRLADMYDVVGVLESYTVSLDNTETSIDLNPSAIGNIPMGATINMRLSVIHDNEPSSNFFGFYHRKEFDLGTIDPITGEGSAKTSLSISKDGATKNSPTDFVSKYEEEGMTQSSKYLKSGGLDTLKSDFSNFKTKFGELKKIGINLPTAVRKKKVEDAMRSYVRISDVADQFGERYGIVSSRTASSSPTGIGDLVTNTKVGKFIDTVGGAGTINGAYNFVVDNGIDIITGQETFDDAITNAENGLRTKATTVAGRVIDGGISTVLGTNEIKVAGYNSINREFISTSLKKASNEGYTPKTIGDIINGTNKNTSQE